MADSLRDGEPEHSPSFRRVWKRRDGSQGSSHLALKAMAVLYDAQQALTRDELAERLLARLDPYERDYLEAWAQRRLEQQEKWDAKYRRSVNLVKRRTKLKPIQRWVTEVFAIRAHNTKSLIRDPDGRFRPGPRAPRIQTMDGKLIPYTPETRKEMEEAEHDSVRFHLAHVELQRLNKVFDLRSREARIQFLIVLLLRVFTTHTKRTPVHPLDERKLVPELKHLLHLADTPPIKVHVLQSAFHAVLEDFLDDQGSP